MKQAAATELIDYIETLKISQGQGAGDAFKVLDWQADFLDNALAVKISALTMARGNGKSTFIAAICAAALDGPLITKRGEILVVASSFAQGRIVFDHCLWFLKSTIRLDPKKWRVIDATQQASIECRATGMKLIVLGSDSKRAMGRAPFLCILDEPREWPENVSQKLYNSLRTGLGKIPNARLLAIGVRPMADTHWFNRLLSGDADYALEYSATEKDKPDDPNTWAKANPSLEFMPALKEEIESECVLAMRDSSELASFRALRLNTGTQDIVESILLEAGTWREIERPILESGERYILGLDLGTSFSMSAAAACNDSMALDSFAVFPELPTLVERGLKDGVADLYTRMAERGELLQRGRNVSSIKELLRECIKRWSQPIAVVIDRWRADELTQILFEMQSDENEKLRFHKCEIITRGMGFKDGSADVRAFQKAVVSGRIHVKKSLLLRSAMGEARLLGDPAGNQKLAKRTEAGRRRRAKDDAVAASILAVSEGSRRFNAHVKRRGVYLGLAS